MTIITKLNQFLAKFVGPNAAHMIDALLALGITFGVAFAVSPAARNFESHHARLGLILLLIPSAGTALASKFRKAAGQPAVDLVGILTQVIRAELAANTATAATPTPAASPAPPASPVPPATTDLPAG